MSGLAQIAGAHASLYEALYQQLDPAGTGSVGAIEAASFLKKSGLSDGVLSKVWDLSDTNGKGFLDKRGFFVALKLVALAQNGNDISISNISSVAPVPKMGDNVVYPNIINWTVKDMDRSKYGEMFFNLSPISGKLPGSKVKSVMLESKLPMETLGKIWDLSDLDQDGALDKEEFILAMHLVNKALQGVPIPSDLPEELIPAIKKKLVNAVPVLPDLLPGVDGTIINRRSSTPTIDVALKNVLNRQWVVTNAEKAKADELFVKLDLDRDGFVSGPDIKDTLLQSGLAQPTLAHIWNLCDVEQTGKLNCEQFALVTYLISQKLQGLELPATLTPEMIPPTLRPKQDGSSETSSKELDMINSELLELRTEKMALEEDMSRKELQAADKRAELNGLREEKEALTGMLKQLEGQKREAQKRLDDLDIQLQTLKQQLEEQNATLQVQEEELNSQRLELTKLHSEETELEQELSSGQQRVDDLEKDLQDSCFQIGQVKAKIGELHQRHQKMEASVFQFDSALAVGDVAHLDEKALGPLSPISDAPITAVTAPPPVEFSINAPDDFEDDPFKSNGFETDPFSGEDPFHAEAFDAVAVKNEPENDPFGNAFTVTSREDPFGSSDPFGAPERAIKNDPFDPFGGSNPVDIKPGTDPFGADPFGPVAPPRPESPTPALPPKKSKAPPPRPAPPKHVGKTGPTRAAPVPPPPAAFGAAEEPFDPFGTGKDPFAASSGTINSFANFADFEKLSSDDAGWGQNMSEDQQMAWAMQEGPRLEQNRQTKVAEREQADLELAIALSKSKFS